MDEWKRHMFCRIYGVIHLLYSTLCIQFWAPYFNTNRDRGNSENGNETRDLKNTTSKENNELDLL